MINEDWKFFEDLFKQYYPVLYAYAEHIVGHDAADDIVQDVFFDLWRNRNKIDFDEPVKPYLLRSVFNRSQNYIKSKYVSSKVPLDDTIHFAIEQYICEIEPEESLLIKEINKEVEQFVNDLPTQCRTIFVLSRTMGLTNKEIAGQLNISVKAVEKQITKALSSLRHYLRNRGFSIATIVMFLDLFFK